FGSEFHAAMQVILHALIERANGSFELHLIRNDVVSDTATKDPDCDNGRALRNVDLPARDGLQPKNNLGTHNDGIDAAPGYRTMRLLPFHSNLEKVGARQGSFGPIRDLTDITRRHDMEAEDSVRLGIIERAFLEHQRRAAFFSSGRAFFCRLKDEFDRAGQ